MPITHCDVFTAQNSFVLLNTKDCSLIFYFKPYQYIYIRIKSMHNFPEIQSENVENENEKMRNPYENKSNNIF